MNPALRSVVEDMTALVPDLGAGWLVLALAPLLLAAVTLLVAGRWARPPGRRVVHLTSMGAAVVSAVVRIPVTCDPPVGSVAAVAPI